MAHYYDKTHDGPLQPFRIGVRARGKEFTLWSASGVFSKEELDAGSRLLIEECVIEDGWKIHDLGCGIGVVGIFIKSDFPHCEVLCTDMSERAVDLTRKNAEEIGLEIESRQSDGYENIPEMFDTILINPPYVAGRETVFRLLSEASEHVRPGGLVQAVARHKKGGEMIGKHLREVLGNCDDSRKKGGFRIYVARKEQ